MGKDVKVYCSDLWSKEIAGRAISFSFICPDDVERITVADVHQNTKRHRHMHI